uniref:NADH-ubiquinone oxidoreductase chain 4 n=1 Tax=Tetrahymena rostrata TaxID=5909 RepID=A0A650DE45_TETRO|nr:NADH dehydrogenase subunit 4 [Tetrahymena rostrata]QGS65290.1 NADH dehydrogenase subunit 4 [Tetrahymena rostrata]
MLKKTPLGMSIDIPLENNFLYTLYSSKIFIELNFFFLLILLFISFIIFNLSKINSIKKINNANSVFTAIKLITIIGLLISFFMHILCFLAYCLHSYHYSLEIFSRTSLINSYSIEITNVKWDKYLPRYFKTNITIDFFGLILLTLAYIVGFISILALDTRLYWKNIKYIFSFNIFLLIVYVYVSVSNLFLFFMSYELLLIPSFFIVYFVSPSRRAIQASLYFVIWTQLGSLLVLIAISYIVSLSNTSEFSDLKYFNFTTNESTIIVLLLFFGFGFKVPIWPFHYWLTKTHVEAPSGFSIYLSGFLVKTALYGFYKLNTSIFIDMNSSVFIAICIMGVVDSSLKMWGQTDLKKLVAYGTIQEMNIIYLAFCWGDSTAILGGILFSATHAFLSALMFFLVDCIYRRFHTRSLVEINGLLHVTPNLGLSILFMLVFFSGIPGTIKFITEFYIFNGLLEASPASCLILMFVANVLGLIGFSKAWFNVVFGMPKKNTKFLPMDLSFKESYIILYCYFFLFIFSYFSYIFF